MPVVIIIEKTGTLKECTINGDLNPDEFYKIAKFKNSDGFENEVSWEVDVSDKSYNISLFAKTSGRAGQENKYELPPPVDEVLYFGRCLLVNEDGTDLTIAVWKTIYEALFGGFDDIEGEDSEEEDDEDLTNVTLTKSGYMKDSFTTEDDTNDSSDENYEDVVVQTVEGDRNRVSLRKLSNEDMESESDSDDSDFIACTDELEEEEYE